MTDTEMILHAINKLESRIDGLESNMKSEFLNINEQLKDIDTSIGMLADWADSVATVTKIPFASGQTSIK